MSNVIDLRPQTDPWDDLRAHTAARIALGRSGAGLPTHELLRFGVAHAQARDAVHIQLDVPALEKQLQGLKHQGQGLGTLTVRSAADNRSTFLLRPDLGRRLHANDAPRLADEADPKGCDLLIVVGDGLSSLAVERQAVPLIEAVLKQAPQDWSLGPIVIATQARVALGDEIGALMNAQLVAMLIGERPGLSSPDSLGIYLTWNPQVGRNDAQRNCISNVRPEGLAPVAAAARMWWLCKEARKLQLTGVDLKDRSDALTLEAAAAKALG
jgi:ethanolamine ammonia-lyase small subunit